jgi:hypothetical protein
MIGDHQLHSIQEACAQRTQERGPDRSGHVVTDVEPEHFAIPGGSNTGGDHDRPGTTGPRTQPLTNVAFKNAFGKPT